MQHGNAPLTPLGRRRLVALVEEEHLTFEAAAAASNVSRSTAHTWVTRWREESRKLELLGGSLFGAAPAAFPHRQGSSRSDLRVAQAYRLGTAADRL